MTRIGIIGDIHLSVTPPGRRTESYLADVQAKLEEIAQAEDVDQWLLIGDLFHSKRANRVPHWLVAWVWDWLTTLTDPCFGNYDSPRRHVYILPGNHDLADGSMASLARQPLAVLAKHDLVDVIDQDELIPLHFAHTHDTFVGIPGTGAVCDATVDPTELFHHDATWIFAHAPVATRALPWATYDAATLPLHANTRGIIYGHQHDAAGALVRPDGKLVIATGAVSRGSITEANHTPSWLVLDTETTQVDVRPIACARPATDIYRWAERDGEKVADVTMAAFVSSLSAEALQGFSREGLVHTIGARADLDDYVRREAVEILADE